MPRYLLLLVLSLGFLGFSSSADAQGPPINEIVVFGDSLCDTGNLFQFTQGDFPFEGPAPLFPIAFYPEGRFSNGPIWIETFAPAAGFATPERFTTTPGGTNFAFGGAESGVGNSLRLTPNIGTQVGFFAATRGSFSGNELVIVWAGGNDFNPVPPATLPSAQQVVANMVTRITEMNQLGGKYFLIPNVPPLGDTPQGRAQGPIVSFFLNLTVVQYNLLLDQALSDLEDSLDIEVFRFNTYGLVANVTANPSQFGFANVTDPAFDLSTLMVVPNPNQYLYWDTLHPTSGSHAVLGKVGVTAYSIGSMQVAFESEENWGIDVGGWFGNLQESGLMLRLGLAKFFLDNGELSTARAYLIGFRNKVNALNSRGRLSAADAAWLVQKASIGIDCLGALGN